MEPQPQAISGIKNNKGKFAVLILYVFLVLVSPLWFFTPMAQSQLESMTTMVVAPDADTFFRNYIDLLRKGDAEKAFSYVSADQKEDLSLSNLKEFTHYFASSTDQAKVIGWAFNKTITGDSSETKYDVFYEMKTTDTVSPYQVLEIVAQDTGSGIQVMGLHGSGFKQSAEERSAFSFSTQGVWLIISILLPLFIVYTAYRYLTKASNPGWVLFLVIIFLTLYIHASGGNYSINFGFNSFATKASPWSPWVFATPIPLGAIYYYFARKKHEGLSTQVAQQEKTP